MSKWFHDLPDAEQELVMRGWVSGEFADWTARFLLSGAGFALKRYLPAAERATLDRVLTQRMVRRMSARHTADPVEQVHAYLCEQVAGVVQQIDDHTGKHGRDAVVWLDTRLSEIQAGARAMYDRLSRS